MQSCSFCADTSPAKLRSAETIAGEEWQNVAAGPGSLSLCFLLWLSVPSGARATGGSASKIISAHEDHVPTNKAVPPKFYSKKIHLGNNVRGDRVAGACGPEPESESAKRRKLDGSVTDRCHSVPPVPHTPQQ